MSPYMGSYIMGFEGFTTYVTIHLCKGLFLWGGVGYRQTSLRVNFH